MINFEMSMEEKMKTLDKENGSIVIPEEMKGFIPDPVVTQILLHIQAYRSNPSDENLTFMTTDLMFLTKYLPIAPFQVKAITDFSKSVFDEMEE